MAAESLCECRDTGEVAATPGQPGDGPMPCPKCQSPSLRGCRSMEEEAYARVILSARPGLLRRRRQLKVLRDFEQRYGESAWLRGLICA